MKKYASIALYVAHCILKDDRYAEDAAIEALQSLNHFPCLDRNAKEALLPAIILGKLAAARRYDLKRPHGAPPFLRQRWDYISCSGDWPSHMSECQILMLCMPQRSLDLLLLAKGFGLTQAAQWLQLPEETAAQRYLGGKRRLMSLLEDDERPATQTQLAYEADMALSAIYDAIEAAYRTRLVERLPLSFQENYKFKGTKGQTHSRGNSMKARMAQVSQSGKVALITGLLAFTVVCTWRAPHITFSPPPHNVPKFQTAQSVPQDIGDTQQEPSLYDLTYTLNFIPDGFRRTEHILTPQVAHIYYENVVGDRILFSQQISQEPVIGFSEEDPTLKQIRFNGHDGAVQTAFGMEKVYWFHQRYCYILSTTLPRTTAIFIARNAGLQPGPYPTLQRVPIEALPEHYTLELARENNDVIFQEGLPPEQIAQLKQFVARCHQNLPGAVRLAHFSAQGAATVADLQMRDGRIYYTLDAHRNDPSQPKEVGEEYERIEIVGMSGGEALLLYSSRYDQPLQAVAF